MGYKPESKHYIMEFVDFPELEVTARGASLGALMKFTAYQDIPLDRMTDDQKNAIFGFFAKRIVTWNVEHPELVDDGAFCEVCGLPEGAPLPTTVEGMLCLELDFIMAIIVGWMQTIASVSPGKLPNSSDGGRNFQEELMSRLGNLQSPVRLPTQN